jgi:hypothetical protein
MARKRLLVWMLAGSTVLACQREPSKPPLSALRRDLELDADQEAYLSDLATRADAHPDDFAHRKASGMAHMRFTLSGVLSLRDRAEADLEAAFALDARDPELNRSLGRFYNMRAVAGDDSKAEQQVEVYRALLGDRPTSEMNTEAFVAWSFFQLGTLLHQRSQGRLFKALDTVKALEATLAARVRAHPGDLELYALAGNFAFFFAGNVPLGRKERVEAGVGYFTELRTHWDALRAGAKDPYHCPNTWENFMFELAEGHLVLEQQDAAREIYEGLAQIRPPATRAKQQIAFVSRERLRNLDAYSGEMDLMPPWPSDVGNCIVCHAYTSDVPLTTLHAIEPITLEDIPTDAVAKPIPAERDGGRQGG